MICNRGKIILPRRLSKQRGNNLTRVPYRLSSRSASSREMFLQLPSLFPANIHVTAIFSISATSAICSLNSSAESTPFNVDDRLFLSLRVDYSGAWDALPVRRSINVSLLGSHYRSMNLSLNGERNTFRSALWCTPGVIRQLLRNRKLRAPFIVMRYFQAPTSISLLGDSGIVCKIRTFNFRLYITWRMYTSLTISLFRKIKSWIEKLYDKFLPTLSKRWIRHRQTGDPDVSIIV